MAYKVSKANNTSYKNVNSCFMKAYITLLLIIINCNLCYSQQLPNEPVKRETKAELYAPIYTLYYPTNQWELTTENVEFLYSYVIQKIKRPDAPKLIIYLEGHTDDEGNSDYNINLSKKRVQAVANYLKNNGIDVNQLIISFFGESIPETRKIAISEKLKDIRYANRRVTIRIEKVFE